MYNCVVEVSQQRANYISRRERAALLTTDTSPVATLQILYSVWDLTVIPYLCSAVWQQRAKDVTVTELVALLACDILLLARRPAHPVWRVTKQLFYSGWMTGAI